MRISGRKYAITGVGRGLGAALAIVMADSGAEPVLLGRDTGALNRTADTIAARTGRTADTLFCDLADASSCAEAGSRLVRGHPDLDGLIHNGAMWLPGSMAEISDADIQNCIASAAIGPLILTRHLLPVLSARPTADIHTVVSTSGLANMPLLGTSVAFRAAKAAQDGFVHGLADECRETSVRVTSVYPGNIEDISPLDAAWDETRASGDPLTNREVVDAILFVLNLPASTTVGSLVIRRHGSDAAESDIQAA